MCCGMPRVLSTSSSCQSPNLCGPRLETAKTNLQRGSPHAALDVYVFTRSGLAFLQFFAMIASSSPEWPRLGAVCSPTTFITDERRSLVASIEHFSLFTVPESSGNKPYAGNEPGTSWWSCRTVLHDESAAMLLCNDMCHTANKCPDPIWQMPSHNAISRVLAVDSSRIVHPLELPKTKPKGAPPPLFVQL